MGRMVKIAGTNEVGDSNQLYKVQSGLKAKHTILTH